MDNKTNEKVNCLIIGSGPAGYTAAIYAARANLKPVLYQGIQPGGQLTITTEVENYPGYPEGIQGPEMMVHFEKQAHRMGADIRYGIATKVDFSSHPYKVEIDEEKWIEANAVIISTALIRRTWTALTGSELAVACISGSSRRFLWVRSPRTPLRRFLDPVPELVSNACP